MRRRRRRTRRFVAKSIGSCRTRVRQLLPGEMLGTKPKQLATTNTGHRWVGLGASGGRSAFQDGSGSREQRSARVCNRVHADFPLGRHINMTGKTQGSTAWSLIFLLCLATGVWTILDGLLQLAEIESPAIIDLPLAEFVGTYAAIVLGVAAIMLAFFARSRYRKSLPPPATEGAHGHEFSRWTPERMGKFTRNLFLLVAIVNLLFAIGHRAWESDYWTVRGTPQSKFATVFGILYVLWIAIWLITRLRNSNRKSLNEVKARGKKLQTFHIPIEENGHGRLDKGSAKQGRRDKNK